MKAANTTRRVRPVWILPEGCGAAAGVDRGAHSSSDAFNPGVGVGDSSDGGTGLLSDARCLAVLLRL